MDNNFENKFYIVSKDVGNQSNCRLFEMEVEVDSMQSALKEIGVGIGKIGMNDIKIDKYSNMMYVACDNGIYYAPMYKDSMIWAKLQGSEKKLPNTMVFDIDFNYTTNTLYAATFGRGIWQAQLVSRGGNNINIGKSFLKDVVFKLDGLLNIGKNKTYTISSKIILCKNSKIDLKKGSTLIIKNKNFVRDENNQVTDINNYLIKNKTAKVIVN